MKLNGSLQCALAAKLCAGILGCPGRSEECCQQVKGRCSLPSSQHWWGHTCHTGSPGFLSARETWGRASKWLRDWSISPVRNGRELGLFILEKRTCRAESYQCLKGGCTGDKVRLFSVVPCDGTRGSGINWDGELKTSEHRKYIFTVRVT